MADEPATWDCPQCTLQNDIANPTCGACEFLNPNAESIEPVVPAYVSSYAPKARPAKTVATENASAGAGAGSATGKGGDEKVRDTLCKEWGSKGRCTYRGGGRCPGLHGELWLPATLAAAYERRKREDKEYDDRQAKRSATQAATAAATAGTQPFTAPAGEPKYTALLRAFRFDDDPSAAAGTDSKTPPISPAQPAASVASATATALERDMKSGDLPRSAVAQQPAAAKSEPASATATAAATATATAVSPAPVASISAAPKLKRTLSTGQKQYEQMMDWMKRNGTVMSPKLVRTINPKKQSFSDSYDLGGMVSGDDMKAGERILSVPQELIIDDGLVEQSEIVQRIRKSGYTCSSGHSLMASFLLQEKHSPGSYWHPYIDLLRLPEEYRNMALFFGETERAELVGSYTVGMLDERLETLKYEYDNLCKAIPDYSVFSLKEFTWARLVVITRVFGLNIDGAKTSGLVPIADLIKHGARTTTWTYDDDTSAFVIDTIEAIPKGNKISLSFGRKCNSRWFVNYGFVLEHGNSTENEGRILINLYPSQFDRAADKKALADRFYPAHPWHVVQFTQYWSTQRVADILSNLRFAVAREEHIPLCAFNYVLQTGRGDESFSLVGRTQMISIENERNALCQLRAYCAERLMQFPCSLEADMKILAAGKVSRRIKDCVLMRVSEKQVYTHHVQLCDMALNLLSASIANVKSAYTEAEKFLKTSRLADEYNTHQRASGAATAKSYSAAANTPLRYYSELEMLYESPKFASTPHDTKLRVELYYSGWFFDLLRVKLYSHFYREMDLRLCAAIGSINALRRLLATDESENENAAAAAVARIPVAIAGTASSAATNADTKIDTKSQTADPAPAPVQSGGVDINTPLIHVSDDECTPLHAAAVRGQLETVKFLIENGANVHMENRAGDTPALALLYSSAATTHLYPAYARYNGPIADRKHDDGAGGLTPFNPLTATLPPPANHDPDNDANDEVGWRHSYRNQAKAYNKTNGISIANLKAGAISGPAVGAVAAAAAGTATAPAAAAATAVTATLSVMGGDSKTKTAPKPKSNEIQCIACTYLNEPQHETCLICGETLPPPPRALMDWNAEIEPRFSATLECLLGYGARAIDRKTFDPESIPNGARLIAILAAGEKRFAEYKDVWRAAILDGVTTFDRDVALIIAEYLLATPPPGSFTHYSVNRKATASTTGAGSFPAVPISATATAALAGASFGAGSASDHYSRVFRAKRRTKNK